MIKKIIVFVCFAILLLLVGSAYVSSQTEKYTHSSLGIHDKQLVTIKKGESFYRVMRILTQNNIAKPSHYVRLMPYFYPELQHIQAGTYQVSPQDSLYQVLQRFNQGKEHQFSITFVEGSRFSQWLTQLKSAPYMVHDLTSLDEAAMAKKLAIDHSKLEGLFLAETYHYTAGDTESQLLARAHKKLTRVLNQQWETRQKDLPLKTPYDALILASIIEKETAIEQERKRVASVFVNRLKKRIRLQTDPTVIYGMGQSYKGNIRKKDLRTPTPYNTYTMRGLPPTPIAMVGKVAIEAALHPENSDYLYFVANGKGGHVFSKSLKEHNRAVRAYLKQLKKKSS